ncbi:MAG: hypothetical protein KAR09_04440 [Bacteroidales bacterium]|nr:hypothetical protein [Bacteroidales bacterium]MCK5338037.1 hypothetical protein [Bacteroidales bacterium]
MKLAEKYLKILLWLIAIHSLTVAFLLICLGENGILYFGFPSGNKFFQVQGGVFHIVMSVAYVFAALNTGNSRLLIIFIITAKFIATVYLLIYYFLFDPLITILLSGIADGLMGLAVLLLWQKFSHELINKGADG